MKQFKYSLQTVHDIRERKRETAELQMTQVMSELAEARRSLETVIKSRQRAAAASRQLHNAHEIEAAEAAAHSDYVNSLILREREARNHIAEIERRVEAKRQELTETARDAEVTAKIREHQHRRHRSELDHNEQTTLDEMVVMAMARQEALHK